MLNVNDNGNISQVDLIYYITVETYPVLPLEFEIKPVETDDGNNKSVGENILYGVNTSNVIITQDERQHDYKLIVRWPDTEDNKNYLYSKEIDYVRLKLNSTQIKPEEI